MMLGTEPSTYPIYICQPQCYNMELDEDINEVILRWEDAIRNTHLLGKRTDRSVPVG